MTKQYYIDNAETFFNTTVNVDMSQQYKGFIKYLSGNYIIDLGCGSGRDSKYFKDLNYEVISIDNNIYFKDLAKEKLNVDITITNMQDINYSNIDGVWACASLLHLNSSDFRNYFR